MWHRRNQGSLRYESRIDGYPHILRFTIEPVTDVRKPSLVFDSTRLLFGSRLSDPVPLAIVMSVQLGLILSSDQRLFRIFR